MTADIGQISGRLAEMRDALHTLGDEAETCRVLVEELGRELTAAQAQVVASDETIERLATELERLEALLSTPPPITSPPPTPGPVPAPPKVLLTTHGGLSANAGQGNDRDKLISLFDIDTNNLPAQGFWADPSSSLKLHGDGSFSVVFDKARRTESPNSGGSSWVNAAIPLARKVLSARMSYEVEFGADGHLWSWGTSGKLPGLMTWTEGQAPGGGTVSPANSITRPCWNDWNRDGVGVRLGPYVYGQHEPVFPEPIWSPNYPGGTLRWGGPVVGDLALPMKSRTHRVELEIDGRDSAKGWAHMKLALNGKSLFWQPVHLVGGGLQITHVAFCFMYGGDDLSFGPNERVTALTVRDFLVEEM